MNTASDIAIVAIHALHREFCAQPEAQDEIFQGNDAVDFVLRLNKFCQDRLPGFVK